VEAWWSGSPKARETNRILRASSGEFEACGKAAIAERPSGSVTLRAFAVPAGAKKIKDLPEPRIRDGGNTRHKQSFDPLEPETGVARPAVEFDPRHALVP